MNRTENKSKLFLFCRYPVFLCLRLFKRWTRPPFPLSFLLQTCEFNQNAYKHWE